MPSKPSPTPTVANMNSEPLKMELFPLFSPTDSSASPTNLASLGPTGTNTTLSQKAEAKAKDESYYTEHLEPVLQAMESLSAAHRGQEDLQLEPKASSRTLRIQDPPTPRPKLEPHRANTQASPPHSARLQPSRLKSEPGNKSQIQSVLPWTASTLKKEEDVILLNAVTKHFSYAPRSSLAVIRENQVQQVPIPKFKEHIDVYLKNSEGGKDLFFVTIKLPNKVQAERLLGKWRELYVITGVEKAEWKFA